MGKLNQRIVFLFILMFNLTCNTQAMNTYVDWNVISSIKVNNQYVYLTEENYNSLKSKNIQMYRGFNNFLISNDCIYIGINGLPIKGYYSWINSNEVNDYDKVIIPTGLEDKIPLHPILLFMEDLKNNGITLYKYDYFDGEDVSYKVLDQNSNILYYDFEKQICGFVNPKEKLEEESKPSITCYPIKKLPNYEKRVYLFINSLLPSYIKSSLYNQKFSKKEDSYTEESIDSYSDSSLFPHGLTNTNE